MKGVIIKQYTSLIELKDSQTMTGYESGRVPYVKRRFDNNPVFLKNWNPARPLQGSDCSIRLKQDTRNSISSVRKILIEAQGSILG